MGSVQEENKSHKDFQHETEKIKVNEAFSIKK